MEYRQVETQIEVRSVSRRLLCGVIVPFGVDRDIDGELVERFERGAFRHQLNSPHRVRLLTMHSRDPGHMQLGHATELREDGPGLYGEFKVAASHIGDHYLAMAKDGSVSQWSVGFSAERDRQERGVTVWTRATVFECALVPEGAYGELASIAQVRSAQLPTLRRDTLLARLPKPRFPM